MRHTFRRSHAIVEGIARSFLASHRSDDYSSDLYVGQCLVFKMSVVVRTMK
jgi:hypothetical protein